MTPDQSRQGRLGKDECNWVPRMNFEDQDDGRSRMVGFLSREENRPKRRIIKAPRRSLICSRISEAPATYSNANYACCKAHLLL